MRPNNARKIRDVTDTAGTKTFARETITISSGIVAPVTKVSADVRAAWTGRAVMVSEMPRSSRAWAPSASAAIS